MPCKTTGNEVDALVVCLCLIVYKHRFGDKTFKNINLVTRPLCLIYIHVYVQKECLPFSGALCLRI